LKVISPTSRRCPQGYGGALRGSITAEALIKAMQESPCRDVNIEPKCVPMPVRRPPPY